MKAFVIAGVCLYLILVLLAATSLERKETVQPCEIAVEEIAEIVNDKIYPE